MINSNDQIGLLKVIPSLRASNVNCVNSEICKLKCGSAL